MDQEQPKLTVELTLTDWQNVLATMEVGIKSIGFSAFVQGGQLMQAMKEQLESQVGKQEQ